jgi:hypothetical protein
MDFWANGKIIIIITIPKDFYFVLDFILYPFTTTNNCKLESSYNVLIEYDYKTEQKKCKSDGS